MKKSNSKKIERKKYYEEEEARLEEELKEVKPYSFFKRHFDKKIKEQWKKDKEQYEAYYEKYLNTKDQIEEDLDYLEEIEEAFNDPKLTEDQRKMMLNNGLKAIERLIENQNYLDGKLKVEIRRYAYKIGKIFSPNMKKFDLFRAEEMIPMRYKEEYEEIKDEEEKNDNDSLTHEYSGPSTRTKTEEEEQNNSEVELMKNFIQSIQELGLTNLYNDSTDYSEILRIAKAWDKYGRQLTIEDMNRVGEYLESINSEIEDIIIAEAKLWSNNQEEEIQELDEKEICARYINTLGYNEYEYFFVTLTSVSKVAEAEECKEEQTENSSMYKFDDIDLVTTSLSKEDINLINEHANRIFTDFNIIEEIKYRIFTKIQDYQFNISQEESTLKTVDEKLTKYISEKGITLENLVHTVEQELLQLAKEWKNSTELSEEEYVIESTLLKEKKDLVNEYLEITHKSNIEEMLESMLEKEALEWQKNLTDNSEMKNYMGRELIKCYIQHGNLEITEWINRAEQTLLIEAQAWEALELQKYSNLSKEEQDLNHKFRSNFEAEEIFKNKNTREQLEEARIYEKVSENPNNQFTKEENELLIEYREALNISNHRILEICKEKVIQKIYIWKQSEEAQSLRLENLTDDELMDVYLTLHETAYYDTYYEILKELLQNAKEWKQNEQLRKSRTPSCLPILVIPQPQTIEENTEINYPEMPEENTPSTESEPLKDESIENQVGMNDLINQMSEMISSINTLVVTSINNQNKLLQTMAEESNKKIDFLIEQAERQQRVVQEVLNENMKFSRSLASTLEVFMNNQIIAQEKKSKKKKKKSKKKAKHK